MRHIITRAVVAVCVALLCYQAQALAQDVRYNYLPGTDFSKYKTYKWVELQGADRPDQILDAQIKQAIDSQLALKGFIKTDGDKADLYVAYQIAISQEREWNAYGAPGWRLGGMVSATSSTISIGTLTVDVYDAAARKHIWRGDATKTLNPSKDPEKRQKNLQKAVAKLLKNFPPPSK